MGYDSREHSRSTPLERNCRNGCKESQWKSLHSKHGIQMYTYVLPVCRRCPFVGFGAPISSNVLGNEAGCWLFPCTLSCEISSPSAEERERETEREKERDRERERDAVSSSSHLQTESRTHTLTHLTTLVAVPHKLALAAFQ